jgi:hypothetical protein
MMPSQGDILRPRSASRGRRRWELLLAVFASVVVLAAGCSSDDSDDAVDSDDAADSHGDGRDHEDMDHEDMDHEEMEENGLAELMADHDHEASDERLDAQTQELLDAQLADTEIFVDAYPTIADAEAAGWARAGQFSPGLGTHYIKNDETFTIRSSVDDEAGEDVQPVLLYDGLEPDAPLAGLMMLSVSESAPEGFAGSTDHWHQHTNVCLVQGDDGVIDAPFGADVDDVTEEMCTDVGGSWLDVTTYMVHVWSIPGYEDVETGVFGGVNPAVTCPDGNYHMIPIEELDGTQTETVCLG